MPEGHLAALRLGHGPGLDETCQRSWTRTRRSVGIRRITRHDDCAAAVRLLPRARTRRGGSQAKLSDEGGLHAGDSLRQRAGLSDGQRLSEAALAAR